MTTHEHPLISDYLRRFDIAAGRVAESRRAALRKEIAAHLGEAVPEGASDAEVRSLIEEFGSPEDIVAQEGVEPVRRNWKPTIIAAAVLVAGALVVGGVIAIATAVNYEEPYDTPVVAYPKNDKRITQGVRYTEYQAAIERMEYPLPAGAEYPKGVPFIDLSAYGAEGVEEETIGGGSLAHFTWLCAWENEYIYALADGNQDRQIAAEKMITTWITSDFYLTLSDPDGNFLTNVIAPMQVGDSSGVQDNLRTSCMIAGLVPRY
jgi:hypothetical protein